MINYITTIKTSLLPNKMALEEVVLVQAAFCKKINNVTEKGENLQREFAFMSYKMKYIKKKQTNLNIL